MPLASVCASLLLWPCIHVPVETIKTPILIALNSCISATKLPWLRSDGRRLAHEVFRGFHATAGAKTRQRQDCRENSTVAKIRAPMDRDNARRLIMTIQLDASRHARSESAHVQDFGIWPLRMSHDPPSDYPPAVLLFASSCQGATYSPEEPANRLSFAPLPFRQGAGIHSDLFGGAKVP